MKIKDRLTKRLNFEKLEDTQKIQRLIGEIEKLNGMWTAGMRLSPQVLNRLKRSVIITSTGASTRIEGVKLSDEEIEELFKLKIKKFATRDEQEIAGYKELLENVFNSWKKIKLSENTIRHFHKELLKYSDKDKGHCGKYKFGSNRVEAIDNKGKIIGIVFDPTPPHLTPKEMTELVDWTNNAFEERLIHPLLIIGNFILEFLAIHPFQDGNGRTSRLLTNFLMLKLGYEYMPFVSHEKFIEDNKSDYYLSLRKSQKLRKQKNEDIAPWLIFFLQIILEQSKMAVRISENEQIEVLLSEKQLRVWNYISEHKYVTPKELRENLEIKEPTILQVLNKLREMKKIERTGSGRGIRYRKI